MRSARLRVLTVAIAAMVPGYVIAQGVPPQPLPSMAAWFNPSFNNTGTSAPLVNDPNYQRLISEEGQSTVALDQAVQAKCNAQGKATPTCYGATKAKLLSQPAIPPSACLQWRLFWTQNACTFLTVRTTSCARETTVVNNKQALAMLPGTDCTCQ